MATYIMSKRSAFLYTLLTISTLALIFTTFSLSFATYNKITAPVVKVNYTKIMSKINLAKNLKATNQILSSVEKTKDVKRILNAEEIVRYFPAPLVPAALKIAICESSLITNAKNKNSDGSRDWGVFQLNDGGTLQHLGGNISYALNPKWNVQAAYRLYQSRGWEPWTCAKALHIPLKKESF